MAHGGPQGSVTKFLSSKEFRGVRLASKLARRGQRVQMICKKGFAEKMRERILEYNGGSWPIGLTIETRE